MEGLANFLDDTLGGILLIALSMIVGGLVWNLFILGGWRRIDNIDARVITRSISIMLVGASVMAVMQMIHLSIKALVLYETLDQSPFPSFFSTQQFQGGFVRGLLAIGLVIAVVALLRQPASRNRWLNVIVLTTLLTIAGVSLVHAAGRFEYRIPLMVMTLLHQLAAAVWVGGIMQLVSLWLLKRKHPDVDLQWPTLLSGFSRIGLPTVVIMLVPAIILAVYYVGSWRALFGTGYGTLITTKVVLLGAALGFAILNYRTAKQWRVNGLDSGLRSGVPYYIQAEAVVLISIIFAAVSLSSQPPAVDTPGDEASWGEVLDVFTPHWPRITSPEYETVIEGWRAQQETIGAPGTQADRDWSEYNHNIAGVFLMVMGVLALASMAKWLPWGRHWPLGFVGLALFLLFRSDPETWPIGPVGFWESSFNDATVLQHNMSAMIAATIGTMEWRVRTVRNISKKITYIYPFLCMAGGILLLTHSHSAFELKDEFLIQLSHTTMGMLAVLMACTRWLELRLEPPVSRYAGVASLVFMILIGAILGFYREPV